MDIWSRICVEKSYHPYHIQSLCPHGQKGGRGSAKCEQVWKSGGAGGGGYKIIENARTFFMDGHAPHIHVEYLNVE